MKPVIVYNVVLYKDARLKRISWRKKYTQHYNRWEESRDEYFSVFAPESRRDTAIKTKCCKGDSRVYKGCDSPCADRDSCPPVVIEYDRNK